MTRTGGTYTGGAFLPGITESPDTFMAFCSEPKESLATNATYNVGELETTNTLQGGITTEKADFIRELFARNYPTFGPTLTAVQAGALQAAIWEIIRETDRTGGPSGSLILNVSSGNIQFQDASGGAGIVAQAQAYLNTLTGGLAAPKLTTLRALTLTGNQDILAMVPEPGQVAAVSGASLLLGVLVLRRRRS
jgi:hypothetical protein